MEDLLVALLSDLQRRCGFLCRKLLDLRTDPRTNDLAISAYQTAATVRREVQALLEDATVGDPFFRVDYFRRFRRWAERVLLVEHHALPALERFNDVDARLCSLMDRLTQEAQIPLASPVVVASSNEYYWTMPFFNLVSVPAGEEEGILGLPDLGHECGHLLLLAEPDQLMAGLPDRINAYFADAIREAIAHDAPYAASLSGVEVQWSDDWLTEFACDVVGAYLFGETYAYQHARLCALFGDPLWSPELGEAAVHPANEARMAVIVAVLRALGDEGAAERVADVWASIKASVNDPKPATYDLAYPPELIEIVAVQVAQGCAAMGMVPFNSSGGGNPSVVRTLRDAWQQFLENPAGFPQDAQGLADELFGGT